MTQNYKPSDKCRELIEWVKESKFASDSQDASIDWLIQLDQHWQKKYDELIRLRGHEAEGRYLLDRKYCELKEEIESLKKEIEEWKTQYAEYVRLDKKEQALVDKMQIAFKQEKLELLKEMMGWDAREHEGKTIYDYMCEQIKELEGSDAV